MIYINKNSKNYSDWQIFVRTDKTCPLVSPNVWQDQNRYPIKILKKWKYQRGNQNRTIQRNCHHRVHKTKKNKTKTFRELVELDALRVCFYRPAEIWSYAVQDLSFRNIRPKKQTVHIHSSKLQIAMRASFMIRLRKQHLQAMQS